MKKYILTGILCAVLIITAYFGIDENSSYVEAFNEYEIYTVKEYCGKIGIFVQGKDAPSAVLDVYVFTLPEADRKMLNEGFDVSEAEIYSVIEDYTV